MKSCWPSSLLTASLMLVVLAAARIASAQADAPAQERMSGQAAGKATFGYEQIVGLAKARARKPYKAPPMVPKFLRDLGFAGLDKIRFKREQALWREAGLPFEAMFYHPGSYFTHAVTMNLVNAHGVTTYNFDKNRYTYPGEKMRERVPDDLGYAGFKLLHDLTGTGKLDETVSFLGASYFRALGADEHYGLSARGLAIDTGSDQGEEFPAFTDFWLVEPQKDSDHVTIYALLDSPSATGAYRFVVTPGDATRTHVEMTLFTRKPIQKLGIAPLTSMFMWGENSLTRLDDYRPEAHDSDGLLISAANGEWLWRPLVNPHSLWLDRFDASNIRGFGLLQRDRNFDHYQDLNYEYERRPNAWITPESDWGDGHLELIQIPSDSEVNDNIVLFWTPKEPVAAGQRLHYSYDIDWGTELPGPDSLGHAVASRVGRAAAVSGQPRDTLRVAIEFKGGRLDDLDAAGAVQPRVNAMRDATINNIEAVRNPHTGGWRLTFLVPAEALDSPLGLRAFLADAEGGALTETWSYTLTP